MINEALFTDEVQAYLAAHESTPISSFIFKGSPFSEITIQELAQQLEGKRRAKEKLPLWYETDGIIFPPKLNLEQTSSAQTATYKASLITGQTLVDGTGGFGIDSYYFSQVVPEVIHVEMNAKLSAFAKANFKTLKAKNITCVAGDSISYFQNTEDTYDTIFLDPGRRNDNKGKVFMLADCLPNVPASLLLLLSKCKTLWVKTAPMLDIAAGLRELHNVTEIHIVAVKNEVKELLWKIEGKVSPTGLRVHCVNLNERSSDHITMSYEALILASATYGNVANFLYEPMATLMKAGAFQWVSGHFKLAKLHEHSHLYTSKDLVEFPGRRFKVIDVLPFSKSLRKHIKFAKANVTTRNFPLSVEEIRKRLKIKEGGKDYLFFTTLDKNHKVVIVCKKI
ncbi:class I SAM-dependent methyltransferase [Dokdonia sinensis]|uniref:Class I SAM-dependent methyltransferase n=1 Tax=Dokdonia sinensis TaxID=2479847 RepID=A0A3M0G3T7_9FLAO|nr:class I SAM-dependent methyltransferase [Dokdonia sinensis]RMB59495.1 class I SAM-dependent methyltransferase [Dokdonia sinensis]